MDMNAVSLGHIDLPTYAHVCVNHCVHHDYYDSGVDTATMY